MGSVQPSKVSPHTSWVMQRGRASATNHILWGSLTFYKVKSGEIEYCWEEWRKEFSRKVLKLRDVGGRYKGRAGPTFPYIVMAAFSGCIKCTWTQISVYMVTFLFGECPTRWESHICPHSQCDLTTYCLLLTLTSALSPSKFRRWDDYLYPLGSCYPKCGLGTRDLSMTWELVKHVECQAPSLTH